VIKDGAVAVQGKCIKAVGTWAELSKLYPHSKTHQSPGVIMPGIVNAHIHLELSVYSVIAQENAESTMCDWVRGLLQKRMTSDFTDEDIIAAAEQCAGDQYATGVVALLDTGNNHLPELSGEYPDIYSLLELIGPSEKATDTTLDILDHLSKETHPTGHAPYSTSPRLLKKIKQHSLRNNSLFSLHVEESSDESLLLLEGTGCFYEFLADRDALDGTFPLPQNSYRSVIDYLDKIKILDNKTICVHCVCVNEEDTKILHNTKSHVCLCPCSNKFIGVGSAPLRTFLKNDIIPALGTDSIASNPQMSLWHEMALLKKEFPDVPSETILKMATIAGAKALGCDTEYGSLEPGKTSHFIAVADEKISTARSEKELIDILVSVDKPKNILHLNGILAD
jgi:cytosine/adenosine deaminase-related metal-dependent hydrolase